MLTKEQRHKAFLKGRELRRQQLAKRMKGKRMSKKVKIGVLVSALWVFGWLVLFMTYFPSQTTRKLRGFDPAGILLDQRLEYTAGLMAFSFAPLLLGWGIWWVMKSDKSE